MPEEPNGILSYTDDALVDMREAQKRAWKLEDEDRKAAALELQRKYDLKRQRIRVVEDMWDDFIRPVLITSLIIGAVVMIIATIVWLVPEGKKWQDIDAAWNTSCQASGGSLALGDISTHDDNTCVFSNGLYQQQYGYALRISYDRMADMCKEIGGTPAAFNKATYMQHCIMPNGFDIATQED